MKTMKIRKTLVLIALAVASSATGVARGNLVTNGGFEANPDGTQVTGINFIDGSTITDWRAFAVGDAGATFTVTSAAGNNSALGMEIAYDTAGADSALDRDGHFVGIPPQERIYKQLVDVRDGGAHGGSVGFGLGFQFFNATPAFTGGRGYGIDPQVDWETTGMTARSHAGDTDLAVRYNVNAGESVYLDNVEVVDATIGVNRMVNGGFENSATRVSDWRFFAVAGAAGSATLSGDAASGSSAALMERTTAAGDSGLDIEPSWMATLGGETLLIDFASKKVSGASDARIRLSVAMFNSGGGHLGDLAGLYDPGTAAYENFSADFTLDANAAFVNIGFRIFDTAGAHSVGAYLIDDVSVVGIPEPASLLLLLIGGVGLAVCRQRRCA